MDDCPIEYRNMRTTCAVEIELANEIDRVKADRGAIRGSEMRRKRVGAMVNGRVADLWISAALAEELGLQTAGPILAKYSDGRTRELPMVEYLRLTYGDRWDFMRAIVEPGREMTLIGRRVLERLDLVVDETGRLVPRDPSGIVAEL